MLQLRFALLIVLLFQSAADDRKEIERLSGLWHGGAAAEQVESFLAGEFIRAMPDGSLWTKADQLKWLREHPAPKAIRNRFDRLEIRVLGDCAIAAGAASLLDSKGNVLDRTVFTDCYLKRDDRWQLVAAHRSQISAKR